MRKNSVVMHAAQRLREKQKNAINTDGVEAGLIEIGNHKYKPLPKQKEFHESGAMFKAYIGGVGSGKTKCGAWEGQLLSLEHPNNYGLIGRKTYPELRDTTMKQFFEECDDGIIQEFIKSELRLRFVNGSEIVFRSLDEIDKIKSLNLGWFWIDEGSEAEEDIFKMLMSRLRRDNVPRRRGFITSNPEGKNWVWRRFAAKMHENGVPFDPQTAKNYELFHAPSTENIYLPEGYISSLMEGCDEDWVKRYIYGEFNTFEGAVYKEFTKPIHIVEPFRIPAHWNVFVGIDFGYTNPFATVFVAENEQGDLFVFDEYYVRETIIDVHATNLKQRMADHNVISIVADPSEPQMIQELGERGVYCSAANNDVMAGINRVKQYLSFSKDRKPKLYIFSHCKHLIFELESYRWKRIKEGVNQAENPIKLNDHAVDALRYVIMGRPDLMLTVQEEKQQPDQDPTSFFVRHMNDDHSSSRPQSPLFQDFIDG